MYAIPDVELVISRLKLKVENTIRWRTVFDKDGNAVKESNARMVKWSDGSMSLHLGSEIFDVYKQPLHVSVGCPPRLPLSVLYINFFCLLSLVKE